MKRMTVVFVAAAIAASVLGAVPGRAQAAELPVPSTTYRSIDAAMAAARPGDVIRLTGSFTGPVRITKSGVTLAGPATITSTGYGVTASGVSDVTLQDLTIRGKKGIYVTGAARWRMTRLAVSASDECVRLKDRSTENVLEFSTIGPCEGGNTGTNGEGVYVGTSTDQTATLDASDRNVVRDNVIGGAGRTLRGECVDIKEGAADNLVARNHCSGSRESGTGGLQSRGLRTRFEDNVSTGNAGAGVRLGGDTMRQPHGGGTVLLRNDLRGNRGPDVNVRTSAPQGRWCGNRLGDASPSSALAVATAPC